MNTWQQTRPRPNLRRVHPLDRWETAMIEDDAHPSGKDLVVCSCLLVSLVVVSIWSLWQVIMWVLR